MKRFLAIYTGTPSSMAQWQALPDAERRQREAAAVAAWNAWGETHAGSILEQGGPLGRTKRVGKAGVSDIRNHMGAFVIVQAESHEEAAKMFVGHPHFTIFPGDGVEIMECLPIPPM